ncbi:MAG TPA: PASTA domain-containing protein [Candidatus Marinimicrobia bacterium]|nr:PASTA domain-containing protein [Candidatus Neomarinimicrobiota bacterium]
MTKNYLKYRSRVVVVVSAIVLAWFGLSMRLFQVQILDGSKYREQGFMQAQAQIPIPAVRGNIYDRNNKPLTRNIIKYSFATYPTKISDPKTLANSMSNYFGRSPDYYNQKLTKNQNFTYLERNINRDDCQGFLEDLPAGLIVERDSHRFYPNGNISAQLIGYTDPDNHGLTGLEQEFDQYLTGTAGWVVRQLSGKGKVLPNNRFPKKRPLDGSNIQLTIDLDYQVVLHEELRRRIDETSAISAMGILMNPQTGAILAMVSIPDFDANYPAKFPMETHKNRVLTDQFEPGSTFKFVAAAAALKHDLVNLQEEFFCENGQYTFAGQVVNDHEDYGLLTFPQIIENSSNVGMIKIAERIGPNRLYRTCRDFGFGMPTHISFAGESAGTLRRLESWSGFSLASVTIGQEVAVTTLQLAMAYSAIANGGFLMKPRLVSQIVNNTGKPIYREEPEVLRKISEPSVMKDLTAMLIQVVETGTGTSARIPGWSIAGKTGTAEKFIDGEYSASKYISNFAGFFPAENPQIVGVLVLNEPRYGLHWGGIGAAPIFRRVIKRIINMDDSIQILKDKYKDKEEPLLMVDAYRNEPEKADLFPKSLSTRAVFTQIAQNENAVPDVRGMSLLQAKIVLRQFGYQTKFSGSGQVQWQSPKPGTFLAAGSICIIGLQ